MKTIARIGNKIRKQHKNLRKQVPRIYRRHRVLQFTPVEGSWGREHMDTERGPGVTPWSAGAIFSPLTTSRK